MSLSLDNVTVSVKTKQLLSGLSLSCEPGFVLGVVGENGAGKSTLLNIMSGLVRPNKGNVSINGADISNQSAASLATIRAVLPQSSDLSFPLAVIEVVRLALSVSRYPIQQQEALLRQCLDRFNVLELAERDYLTLSGGEKQRVQLARVTAQLMCHQQDSPQYLLLDEPISALDLYQQYQTLQNIRELTNQSIGIVAVLHDLNLASMYCDRIAILKDGKLVNEGLPTQVITPQSIKDAFHINVQVQAHPDTKTPYITPLVNRQPGSC